MEYYFYSAKGRQEFMTRSRNTLALLSKRKPYTLKVLDDHLKTLRAADIPNLQYSDTLGWGESESEKIGAAFDALTSLAIIAERCTNPETDVSLSLKQTTIEKIIASFDLIEELASFFLTPRAPFPKLTRSDGSFPNIVAFLLDRIVELHPSILQRLCSSTTSIDLVIRLWTTENEDGQPYANIESDLGCGIVPLILHCIAGDEGRGAFVDRMGSREVGLPQHVALMTIKRLNAARFTLTGNGLSKVSPEAASGYLKSVLVIIERLVTSPRMHRAFELHDYAPKIATTLREFSQFRLKAPRSAQYTQELCVSMGVALQAILGLATDNQPRNLALALAHGFMGTLVSLIKACASGRDLPHPNARILADCLQLLETYLPWNSVLLQLQSYFEGRSEAEMMIGRAPEPLGEGWKLFGIAVREHLLVYNAWGGKTVLCDNLQCQRDVKRTSRPGAGTVGGSASLLKSRECSGCSTFVYCGEHCQKQDWDARHSKECASARVDTITRRATPGAWYSPRQRAYHVALIEHRFNYFLSSRYGGSAIEPDKVTSTPPTFTDAGLKNLWSRLRAPRVFYLNAAWVQSTETPFDEIYEGDYTFRSLQGMAQSYLQPRIDEYLWASGVLDNEPGRCTDKKEDMSTVKYVECSLTFGETDLHVMVKMRLHMDERRGVGRFLAVSSMARFGLKPPMPEI
ncbi:hypothetical protein DFP72DRAFT_51528 [Ephemerocybe angulata]|uniref:MYND-type domain-containing protein n=1 Tax=Ephemerocybe angulata TaxID=980116 RepID=A0A8H6HGM4_9AGAR|nr:hypothetical protein DFP72DRAFT_51528 [Tulosesus angulatus]